ncbi:DUF2779 domain-containing protein [Variovorax sp. J22R24]|uniref:DUF2779 domain-containing protein n=1 Tax=Variovorax gracilis TaxID=3053502 RepID=UPI002577BA6D|nr:DUF2779 domain-containing protein [Variovorax sp. J22R24]MDM0108484.1 DUF2779 domain-containing protein [Variovorax sp. J22R24]
MNAIAPATVTPRYLTKSRFKLALECPTKLFYTGKAGYLDNALDDSFLQALAEGGFQVGALACLMYPGGIEVTERGHAAQLARTQELLQRDEVTIYEAALQVQGLFVRVDILRKRGDQIELIEVKAKSYDPQEDGNFRNRQGRLKPGMLPYLQDIAFQRHVASLAHPEFRFRSFLMLADKSAVATVDGLNQRFRIQRDGGRSHVEVAPGTDPAHLGAPLLRAVPVDEQVDEILAGNLRVGDQEEPFAQVVDRLAVAYRMDKRFPARPGVQCARCEFKTAAPPIVGQPRSGFHECWSEAFGWQAADFAGGTVLDLWNSRKKAELLATGVRKLREITLADLPLDDPVPGAEGMSREQRQWFQCSGQWPEGGEQYVDTAGLARAMTGWRYPLHFIDFETSAVAIPFGRGQRPYQTTAFQFSHHVMHADGRVEHKTQFLEARPGVPPSLPFLRALRDALGQDEGTVFRWATHENTVLNQLAALLRAMASPPPDAQALIAFVETLTERRVDNVKVVGPRNMIDLCALAERHYFHPATQGSCSLKKVLPALMQSSARLRELYAQPAYGQGAQINSLNHQTPMAWWVRRDVRILDPYELLPPVFTDLPVDARAELEDSSGAELRSGGSAMAAYARLQFEDLDPRERQSIEAALLRYCELDTLAMVMAVQAWQAWVARAET